MAAVFRTGNSRIFPLTLPPYPIGNGSEASGKFPKISGFNPYIRKRKDKNGSENGSHRFPASQFPSNSGFRFPPNPDPILKTLENRPRSPPEPPFQLKLKQVFFKKRFFPRRETVFPCI